MSEIPSKKYLHSGLHLAPTDVNPWLVATKYYSDCIQRFITAFPTKQDAINELKSPNVNNICKKELNYLRDLSTSIRYKEVLGSQQLLADDVFLEEIQVQSRK